MESIERPGRCSGRCPGGQAEVGEDLGNHGGSSMAAMIFKVTLGALLHVDLKDSFEQPGPGSWGRRRRRGHLTVVR